MFYNLIANPYDIATQIMTWGQSSGYKKFTNCYKLSQMKKFFENF